MEPSSFIITLPVWMESFLCRFSFPLQSVEERMQFVISMVSENIKRKTGGPFAAAVFNRETGELVAPGVNRVVPLNCSIAHAEMVTIGLAQQRLSTFDLGAAGLPPLELVTSTEPCAMCLGAIPWSGIRYLVCGATDSDARGIGFDEGAKPENWVDDLTSRGIHVETGICREAAGKVLQSYANSDGTIYNGRSYGSDPSVEAANNDPA